MNRPEFEALRDLAGKTITGEIRFESKSQTRPNLTFEKTVQNALGWDLVLNGAFNPLIPSVSFNFHVRGTGPICRLEVNGLSHNNPDGLNVGRTHKHDLREEHDSRKNLPMAQARPELNLMTMSVGEIWTTLCKQANIVHKGTFHEP